MGSSAGWESKILEGDHEDHETRVFVIFVTFVAFVFFVAFVSQKSICAPSLKKRGVSTDVGASHACEPVVTAGLKFWL